MPAIVASIIQDFLPARNYFSFQGTKLLPPGRACYKIQLSVGRRDVASIVSNRRLYYIARNIYKRLELDYLICNAPLKYVDLILNGDSETYLKTVTEYKSLD